MVYDLDGDGKAEVACKTADGTIDGKGTVIGDANADYRNSSGYILSGPEYFTIFDGLTGKALATTNYLPARGDVNSWVILTATGWIVFSPVLHILTVNIKRCHVPWLL